MTQRLAQRRAPGTAFTAPVGLSLLFAVSRVLVVLYLAGRGTDLAVHAGYAAKMAAGGVPFRDFFPEYPPLALLFVGLPRLLAPSPPAYFATFRAVCFVVDCGIWAILLHVNRGRPAQNLLYILCTTALGPVLYDRIDLLLGALLLVAVVSLHATRDGPFYLALGAAIAFKLIPVVWAPAALGWEWAKPAGGRRVVRALLLLGLPTTLSFLPVALLGGYRFDRLFAYHRDRPIQIESTPASAEMVLMALGVKGTVSFEYGSVNLHTAYGPALVAQTTLALATLVLGSAAVAASARLDRPTFGLLLAAVLVATIFLSKVLSPQFLLFLLPPLLVLPGPATRRRAAAECLLVLAVYLLTGLIFPWFYDDLLALRPAAQAVLLLRNVGLGALGVLLIRRAVAGAATRGVSPA